MVKNNLWAFRREMLTPNNNQQSANGRTPQARPQNHLMGANNVTQEGCHQNNNADVDAATLPVSSFSSSRSSTPTVPSYRASLARYGQTLPLDLPQSHMSSANTPTVPSYRASLARYGQTLPLDLPQLHMSSANTPIIPSDRASLARYGQTLPLNLPQPRMSSANTPIIPSYRASLARYGQPLSLDLPQPQMSSLNTPMIPSYHANLAQNSLSSCLGSQGVASGFRNPSKPNLHNQKNSQYHPYEEGSSHENNSLVFNDFDPLSRVDMNSIRNLRNYVPPIATPPPIHPSGNANLDLPNSIRNLRNYVPPIATPPPIRPSGNANLDSTRESNIPSYRANLARNSSSSLLGSQGFANHFRNPSKPNLQNQKNSRYHPYGEGSNHKNNSLVFNDFDPHSEVDMNSFHNLRNYVPPIATPPPIHPSSNANLDLTLERTTEHHDLKNCVAPIATPSPIRPSGNANLDLTLERTTEHRMFEIQNTDGWKRLTASPEKELLLFKDDKNTSPTSLVIESGEANENDDEPLDLELHL